MTEAATDDRGLVRRMRAGEEAAFGQFFEESVVQVTLCKAVTGLKGHRRLVQVTLDTLPFSHGLSVKEIAGRLNLRLKAAESLLTRAREAFRGGFAAVAKSRWSER